MAPLGYIEVLDAKGNVTERIGIDAFPITVGRAYSNHVVVDDPYVCPAHLAIEPDEQGRLIARDRFIRRFPSDLGHRTMIQMSSTTCIRPIPKCN